MKQNTLIILGGLPGTGKTTLAQKLAQALPAVYIRIDTIEQELKKSGSLKVGNEGYRLGYALAADNLKAGQHVIADSVNPVAATRDAWKTVGRNCAKKTIEIEIEITCSDKNEHKSRIETRQADIAGHELPTWEDVVQRAYEPWPDKNIQLDTAGKSANASFDELLGMVGRALA